MPQVIEQSMFLLGQRQRQATTAGPRKGREGKCVRCRFVWTNWMQLILRDQSALFKAGETRGVLKMEGKEVVQDQR